MRDIHDQLEHYASQIRVLKAQIAGRRAGELDGWETSKRQAHNIDIKERAIARIQLRYNKELEKIPYVKRLVKVTRQIQRDLNHQVGYDIKPFKQAWIVDLESLSLSQSNEALINQKQHEKEEQA